MQAYRSQLEEKYKNDGRKLEFLAIRALMYEMVWQNRRTERLFLLRVTVLTTALSAEEDILRFPLSV